MNFLYLPDPESDKDSRKNWVLDVRPPEKPDPNNVIQNAIGDDDSICSVLFGLNVVDLGPFWEHF